MKFVIKALLLFCLNVQADPIRIYHEGAIDYVDKLKEELKIQYQIPEDLISISGTTGCEYLKTNGKLDLCIKSNGDLWVVSVDKGFIEALKIFKAP